MHIMSTFSDLILPYLFEELPQSLNRKDGVSLINPFHDPETRNTTAAFYKKYYNDTKPRVAIIGINPGRYGGAVTGVPFTDPVALSDYCGIANPFPRKRELSSRFVYEMILKLGGPVRFYSGFYFATMFPLALIKDEKNYNYYDSADLYKSLRKSIIHNLKKQLSFGLIHERAIVLGKKNHDFLSEINQEHKLFERTEWIEHPRYIQQYKLKQVDTYIEKYKRVLGI